VSVTPVKQRPSALVVGSGVSGLTAAYLLRRTHQVTLLEAQDRLGGHAHTHRLTGAHGVAHDVDSGFIVHNDRTYPLLRRLFAELDVRVRPTEMSMSISCGGCGLEYAGGRGVGGLLAQRRRAVDPRFLRLLVSIKRFQRAAGRFLASAEEHDLTTLGGFLAAEGFDDHFVHHYAVPVVSCVWSSGHASALDYPAAYLFRFLEHHGFLSVSGSPQWYTVLGGSQAYVQALRAALEDDGATVLTGRAATEVARKPDGVEIVDSTGALHVADAVVLAAHADESLAVLTDPTDAETRVLGAFTYARNETVLHTDASVLPIAKGARSAWNYTTDSCDSAAGSAVVSYWMNRLQGLPDGATDEQYVVTLNATRSLDPTRMLATMDYSHPLYTAGSVSAHRELAGLNTEVTAYAGAYHGWGFHEDGCRSGVAAARSLGDDW
jgi:predicted NAD/FAD-binding protein